MIKLSTNRPLNKMVKKYYRNAIKTWVSKGIIIYDYWVKTLIFLNHLNQLFLRIKFHLKITLENVFNIHENNFPK